MLKLGNTTFAQALSGELTSMFMSVFSGKTSSVTALLTAGMEVMKRSVLRSAVSPLMNSNVGTPQSVSQVRSSAMESKTANMDRMKRKGSVKPGPVLRTELTNVTTVSASFPQILMFAMVKRTAKTALMNQIPGQIAHIAQRRVGCPAQVFLIFVQSFAMERQLVQISGMNLSLPVNPKL